MRTSLIVLGVVVVVAGVAIALFAYSTTTSAPVQISYEGHTYNDMVKVSAIEAAAHVGALHPVHKTMYGMAVYTSAGAVPQVVALALSPGEYDAYQLSG